MQSYVLAWKLVNNLRVEINFLYAGGLYLPSGKILCLPELKYIYTEAYKYYKIDIGLRWPSAKDDWLQLINFFVRYSI